MDQPFECPDCGAYCNPEEHLEGVCLVCAQPETEDTED